MARAMYIPLPILLLIVVLVAAVLLLVMLLLHTHGLLKLPLRVRVFWWSRLGNPNTMPKDVREHIIRSDLQATLDSAKTVEEKKELATRLMGGALGLDADQIGPELRDELIAAAMRVHPPVAVCTSCRVVLEGAI
jgi:membrane protein required for beta-lactamase induction